MRTHVESLFSASYIISYEVLDTYVCFSKASYELANHGVLIQTPWVCINSVDVSPVIVQYVGFREACKVFICKMSGSPARN